METSVSAKKENESQAMELLRKYNLNLTVDSDIYRLTQAQGYELLICRAILCGARLLICQEIGEGVSDHEAKEIREFLLQLKREGLSFLLLNVNFESTMAFADTLSIMRDGMICYSEKMKEVSLYSVYKCMESNQYTEYQEMIETDGGQKLEFMVMFPQKDVVVSLKVCLVEGTITGLFMGEAPVVGKENLLYRILYEMELIRGRVLQNGKSIPVIRWLQKHREELCYLGVHFWENNVFHTLTVGENVILSAISQYKGRWTKAMEKLMLREFAERYGIEVDFSQYPKQLSTGEYNQIVLWRLLFYPPRYLILLNPMFGADEPLREKFLEMLSVLRKRNTYILWINDSIAPLKKYCRHIEYPDYFPI